MIRSGFSSKPIPYCDPTKSNMNLVHSTVGVIHLASAIGALATGTLVLVMHKGTRRHKRIGYVYTVLMLTLNFTAFCIYRLFNGFGPFHLAAILSLVALVAGMGPVLLRKPATRWLSLHFAFMYYSVIGLYAAFVSEVVTRIPGLPFGVMVGVGTGLVMLVGIVVFELNKKKWNSFSNQ